MQAPAASDTGSFQAVAGGGGVVGRPVKERGKALGWWWGAALVVGGLVGAAPAHAQGDDVARGAYLARAGDCVACHTAPGGSALAGGLPLSTPFGTVHSTNITPDRASGIGDYTFEQFDRAMRKGVAADGHRLYPAMPYPSFAKITEADMRDLYAYLMRGVAPVRQANRALGIKWPFSMRWGLAAWNWMFLDDTPFVPNAQRDAAWNRGAYLVQGLGHCGACHTPRGIGFQEKAMSEAGRKGALYLSGEKVEAWNASNLRNLWTKDDLVTLLKTGQNRYGVAAGGMTEVIQNSTPYLTDADLGAMAAYLKSLPGGGVGAAAVPAVAGGAPDGLYTSRGGLGYVQFCAACHQDDGRGFTPVFPALTHNLTVQSGDPDSLIHIALTGWKSARTQTHARVYTMPRFAQLADGELADILNFVRAAWGGHQDAITVTRIGKLRKQVLAPEASGAHPLDIPRFAALLDAPNAGQLVRGLRLNLQTKALLPDHVGDALNCMSCHLGGGTVARAAPYVGLAAQFPSYAPRAGKVITLADRINGCFLRSMNGQALPVDSDGLQAMVAYFDWMTRGYLMNESIPGRGVGRMDPGLQPDPARGKTIYAAQYAACHGEDGQGGRRADGTLIYPPLWGAQSFNIGAGMARLYTAAAFVKHNMPMALHGDFPLGQGGLSDQDAVDVAAYFTTQPRNDFPPKVNDWPKDGKPKDARY